MAIWWYVISSPSNECEFHNSCFGYNMSKQDMVLFTAPCLQHLPSWNFLKGFFKRLPPPQTEKCSFIRTWCKIHSLVLIRNTILRPLFGSCFGFHVQFHNFDISETLWPSQLREGEHSQLETAWQLHLSGEHCATALSGFPHGEGRPREYMT